MVSKIMKNICVGALLLVIGSSLFGAAAMPRRMSRQELEDKQLADAIALSLQEQRAAEPRRAQPAMQKPRGMSYDEQMAEAIRQSQAENKAAAAAKPRPQLVPLSEEQELQRVLELSRAEAEEKEAGVRPNRPVRKNYALVIEVADVPSDELSMDNFQAFLKNRIVGVIKDANLGEGISVYPFVPKLKGSGKSYHHFTFLMLGAKPELNIAQLKSEILKALNDATAQNPRVIEGNHLVNLHSTDGLEARIIGKSQYVLLDAPVPKWLETMAQFISAQLGVLGPDVSREHFQLYAQGGKVYQPHVTMLSIVDKNKQLSPRFLPSQMDRLNERAAMYRNPFVRGSKVIGQINTHRISLTLKEGHDIIPQAVFVYDPLTYKWHEGR